MALGVCAWWQTCVSTSVRCGCVRALCVCVRACTVRVCVRCVYVYVSVRRAGARVCVCAVCVCACVCVCVRVCICVDLARGKHDFVDTGAGRLWTTPNVTMTPHIAVRVDLHAVFGCCWVFLACVVVLSYAHAATTCVTLSVIMLRPVSLRHVVFSPTEHSQRFVAAVQAKQKPEKCLS